MKDFVFSTGLAVLLGSASTNAVAAAQASIIYKFKGAYKGDGVSPQAGLIADKSGRLYTTTTYGGTGGCYVEGPGCGTIVRLTPPASGKSKWVETVLYSFLGSNGALPQAALTQDGHGNLYTTTESGGAAGDGAVIELSPPVQSSGPWTEAVLYSFGQTTSDGMSPYAGLTSDGKGGFYTTTGNGGAYGKGTVVHLEPPPDGGLSWTESVIYSFEGTSDGGNAYGDVSIDRTGNLYTGTASGGANNAGTVIELSPPAHGHMTWTETTLYSFAGPVTEPRGASTLLLDGSGNIFAATGGGPQVGPCYGGGCGFIVELSPPVPGQSQWSLTVLHQFTGGNADGSGPSPHLIEDATGALYVTAAGYNGLTVGAIDKLVPPQADGQPWTFVELYLFPEVVGGLNTPYAGLLPDASGNLYTTASGGGISNGQYRLGAGGVLELTNTGFATGQIK